MPVKDRFTRGWIAGACGGLLGGLLGFLPYYMDLSSMRISDWSSILVLGRTRPFSFDDQAYGLFVLAWSTGCVGIIFSFLLTRINEENIYFKGWIIFLIPWWFIYLFTALAKTKGTMNLSVLTAMSDGISASIMGVASVFFYKLLTPK